MLSFLKNYSSMANAVGITWCMNLVTGLPSGVSNSMPKAFIIPPTQHQTYQPTVAGFCFLEAGG
jgi:hypothetical protein